MRRSRAERLTDKTEIQLCQAEDRHQSPGSTRSRANTVRGRTDDCVISVAAAGVAVLADAISKDPKFFVVMAGFFVFGPYIPKFLFGDFAKKEEEALLDQIRQELGDLKGHIEHATG